MTGLNWYLHYKGQYYDAGTKVKIKTRYQGDVITIFRGNGNYDGLSELCFYSGMPPEHYIVEIIEPVYYNPLQQNVPNKKSSIFTRTGSGSWQSSDDIVIGLIWYIIVMVVGSIFNARLLIWAAATIIFFVWKAKK